MLIKFSVITNAMISYSDSKNIDPEKLDNLWTSIGWKSRGKQKWNEVI